MKGYRIKELDLQSEEAMPEADSRGVSQEKGTR